MKRFDEKSLIPGAVLSGIASLLLWAGHRVMEAVDDMISDLSGEEE